MPDGNARLVERSVFEGVIEGGVVAFVLALVKKFTAAAATEAVQQAAPLVGRIAKKQMEKVEQCATRRELYVDLQFMEWADKVNLIGLLKKAMQDCRENHLVNILSQIPKDDITGSREYALVHLNRCIPADCMIHTEPCDEGPVLLALLDDDGFKQEMAKLGSATKRAAQKAAKLFESALKSKPGAPTVAGRVGSATKSVDALFGPLADWFEKK